VRYLIITVLQIATMLSTLPTNCVEMPFYTLVQLRKYLAL